MIIYQEKTSIKVSYLRPLYMPLVRELVRQGRDRDGESSIDVYTAQGVKFVGCVNGAIEHDDADITHYSWLLVVHNEGFLAKGVDQRDKELLVQRPGTLLLLDARKEHLCDHDPRLRKKVLTGGLWIAMLIDHKGRNPVKKAEKIKGVFAKTVEELR